MENNLPFVSVIIPCRNEEKFIEACLKTLAEHQTYPKEKLEILVVDGMSEDKTREIIEEYRKKHSDINIKTLENIRKFTPFAMNIGINPKESKGDIIVKADAHTQYQPEFVQLLVNYLYGKYKGKEVDVVGGQIITPSIKDIETLEKDKNKQIKIRAIALCLSNYFGSASSFRIGTKEPRFVDTVFGVGYRRETLEKIKNKDGTYFNENLWRSQDLELNLRIKRGGGNILLVPSIQFKYYPKSNFREFFVHNFVDGEWAIYPFKFTKRPFRVRHYIPLVFILAFFSSIFLITFSQIFLIIPVFYIFLNLLFSIQVSFKEKKISYIYLMFISFLCRHFGYGLGSIWGLIKIIKD